MRKKKRLGTFIEIRGHESHGMILAADDEGRPVLLHPDKEIPAGSIVR